jgi:orotate phosphoribosyltransferase
VSIFTYGMKKGLDALTAAGLTNVSLTDFDTLCGVAAKTGYIKTEDLPRLRRFRDNPSDESWTSGGGR